MNDRIDDFRESTPIHRISSRIFPPSVEVFIKRDDLIHPFVSGNKWRKLKYNVSKCLELKSSGILTFGGAYSNHLIATAAACAEKQIKSIGIVRGEEHDINSNYILRLCYEFGMNLSFVERSTYKNPEL